MVAMTEREQKSQQNEPLIFYGINTVILFKHVFWPLLKAAFFFHFPGGPVVKNLPVNAGDMGSIPPPERCPMQRSNKVHESQLLSPRSRAHVLRAVNPLTTATES